MTKTAPPLDTPDLAPQRQGILGWVTTTDHKTIGIAYIVTAIVFFLIAGIFAELMRLELATPGIQLFEQQAYNELFTMHGTVMIFLFAVPVSTGIANYIVPLERLPFVDLGDLPFELAVGFDALFQGDQFVNTDLDPKALAAYAKLDVDRVVFGLPPVARDEMLPILDRCAELAGTGD